MSFQFTSAASDSASEYPLEPQDFIRNTGGGVTFTMTAILVTMLAALVCIALIQTRRTVGDSSSFLPCPTSEPTKRGYEIYVLSYSVVWIAAFAVIILTESYEDFTATSYNVVCIGLSLPYLLQPIIYPSVFGSPDGMRSWYRRYSTKANLWIGIFSFIGNYWYTHYFYSVLKARYTMPSNRFNDVPIALYFATHFYFSTYHAFSNVLLRKVVTTYEAGISRSVLFMGVVICFSYFTAFMETLTISTFPYYTFEDRDMAYTVGSAFYGIYFLVSFPMFFYFDRYIDREDYAIEVGRGKKGNDEYGGNRSPITLWDTVVSSFGCGMMVLCLLDFVRLYLGVPLVIRGSVPED